MLNLKRFLQKLLPFNGFSAEDKEKAATLLKVRGEPLNEIYRKFGSRIKNAPRIKVIYVATRYTEKAKVLISLVLKFFKNEDV